MASYVGLVRVVITLIVAFFAVLFNLISHVFNYFDGLRFPEKLLAPRRRRPQIGGAAANRHNAANPVNNIVPAEPEDDDSEDVAETASRRL